MRVLLKLILLVILTTVCYSQGKIVSVETITNDFGEVTSELVMSVTEFNELINQSSAGQFNSLKMDGINVQRSTVKLSNTVGLKFINGKLFIEGSTTSASRSFSTMLETMPSTIEEIGYKDFNKDMINTLNTQGGESVIKIQERNGELVLTNGDYSYNYIDD